MVWSAENWGSLILWTGSVSENNPSFETCTELADHILITRQTVVEFRAVVLTRMYILLGSHSCLATNTSKGRAVDSLQQVEACLPTGGSVAVIFECSFSFTQSHDSYPDKGRVTLSFYCCEETPWLLPRRHWIEGACLQFHYGELELRFLHLDWLMTH